MNTATEGHPWQPDKAKLPEFVIATGTIKRCTGPSCGRLCAWATTRAKQRILLDLEPDHTGKYPAHISTCPDADRFRKRITTR